MLEGILGALRLAQFVPALGLFGSALLSIRGALPDETAAPGMSLGRAGTRSAWLLAAVAGLVATIAWLSAEAAYLTGAWTELAPLLTATHFGRAAALRAGLFALLIPVCLFLRRARTLAIAVGMLGAATVASFAWTGHGGMNMGSARVLHLGADVLHLLAAGSWFGGLCLLAARLLRACRDGSARSMQQLAVALRGFSLIGPTVVGLLTLSGLVNAWYLVGVARWPAPLETAYGWWLLAKLLLFAGMLGLAAVNRWRLVPRLEKTLVDAAARAGSLRALRSSVLAETALACLVIAAVAVLGMLMPPVSAP